VGGSNPSCPPDDCQGEGDGDTCDSSFSSYPIRYSNGEIRLVTKDLESRGFGLNWGHTRNYGNRVTVPGEGINGNSWFVKEVPYLAQDGNSVIVVGLINDVLWFDWTGSAYSGRYYILDALTHDTGNKEFVLRCVYGQVLKFYDFDASHPAVKRGAFKSFTDAGGNLTTVSYGGNNLISSFEQGSGGTTCGYHYSYYSSGVNANRLQYVTLKVDGSDVRRASYDYYDGSDSNGSAGDLRRAQIQEPSGNDWATIAAHYYRYYKSGDPDGVVNGLKYVVSPLGYAAMVAAGITPETATDVQVKLYARHYFRYNADRSVKDEFVNGGVLNFGFTVSTSGFGDGVNNWKYKTIETRPDGNRQVVYTNYQGQPMLKVLVRMSGGQETSDKWYEYFQYDSAGRVTLRANSSAVQSVSEGTAGLVTLKSSAGSIRLFEYYSASPPAGGAPGRLQYEKIKEGSGGTALKIREYTYEARTVSGNTIYVPKKEICYPSDTDQLIQIECTVYSYTWHTDSFQINQRTTTLPAVADTENGSGNSNTQKETFNTYGQVTAFEDERGYVTAFSYDASTGGLTQMVQDSGGQNLTTNYTVDSYGRETQALGPTHSIDIGGTNTEIHRARWTVYKDDELEVWVGRGYQKTSDSSFTLIDPVQITRVDQSGRLTDTIEAKRTSGTGKLAANNTFAQTDWVSWKRYLYSSSPSIAAARVYHSIPSSGEGTVGTNYEQTDYGYDVMRRLIRVKGPEGTITRNVFLVPGWVKEVWAGTDDTGATSDDPTGGGAQGNNMVKTEAFEYDGNSAGGDGNQTKHTQWENGSDTRVTSFGYDWRNRRTSADGEIDFFEEYTYDNLDRLTKTDRKNTTSGGALVARTETKYDSMGRVYQRLRYSVSGGTAGNSLKEKIWYDAAGNVMKRVAPGSRQFEKMQYDAVGRLTKQFKCFSSSEENYAASGSVANNTVQEQTENTYDNGEQPDPSHPPRALPQCHRHRGTHHAGWLAAQSPGIVHRHIPGRVGADSGPGGLRNQRWVELEPVGNGSDPIGYGPGEQHGV